MTTQNNTNYYVLEFASINIHTYLRMCMKGKGYKKMKYKIMALVYGGGDQKITNS